MTKTVFRSIYELINKNMKKALAFVVTLMICFNTFSQKAIYIELKGQVDILGNICIDRIGVSKNQDSLINLKKLKANLFPCSAIEVFNKFSLLGWSLVSVTCINSDKEGRPNSPFILYYLKKDFDKQKLQ